MPTVLDIEQALLLLELEPPFDKRDVQLARRRLAKLWHPDIAPPGQQFEHERHLKAINEAADQLERARRELARRHASSATRSRSAPRPRARRARRRAAAPTRRSSAAAQHDGRPRKHDPFGSRVPDHSVVHRYARCLSYPEWGVGTVTGIYFTGDGDDVQQWARVQFPLGVRTVPGRLAAVRRLLQARPGRRARAALHDRGAARAGRGRLRARRQAPGLRARRRAAQRRGAAADDARVLAGRRPARRRPRRARLGARRGRPPGAAPLRRAHLRGHGRDRAGRGGRRARGARAPQDARRVGAGRAAAAAADRPRGRARGARARAAARAERRGPARPRARPAPRRRRRRRGDGVRAGDAAGLRSRRPRGRATRTRWRAPIASATRSPPAERALDLDATTPRSPTCSSACAPPPRVLPAA